MSQTLCFFAIFDKNSCIGPWPSCSRTRTLSVSVNPIIAKYSGNTTSFAPWFTATSISRSASFKLDATTGPDAI